MNSWWNFESWKIRVPWNDEYTQCHMSYTYPDPERGSDTSDVSDKEKVGRGILTRWEGKSCRWGIVGHQGNGSADNIIPGEQAWSTKEESLRPDEWYQANIISLVPRTMKLILMQCHFTSININRMFVCWCDLCSDVYFLETYTQHLRPVAIDMMWTKTRSHLGILILINRIRCQVYHCNV